MCITFLNKTYFSKLNKKELKNISSQTYKVESISIYTQIDDKLEYYEKANNSCISTQTEENNYIYIDDDWNKLIWTRDMSFI